MIPKVEPIIKNTPTIISKISMRVLLAKWLFVEEKDTTSPFPNSYIIKRNKLYIVTRFEYFIEINCREKSLDKFIPHMSKIVQRNKGGHAHDS